MVKRTRSFDVPSMGIRFLLLRNGAIDGIEAAFSFAYVRADAQHSEMPVLRAMLPRFLMRRTIYVCCCGVFLIFGSKSPSFVEWLKSVLRITSEANASKLQADSEAKSF